MRVAHVAALVVLSCAPFLVARAESPEAPTPIAGAALVTLGVAGYPDFLAADGADVWVTNEGRIEKLRAGESKPVTTVALPEPCGAMVVAFESVWVASCRDRSLFRVDRSSGHVLKVIRTGLADPSGELSVAAGAGSIWLLTDATGVLSRIDPRTNKVTASIKVKPESFAAVFGFGAVWITNTNAKGSGSVQRIDPASNSVVATTRVGPVPRFLAAGEGGVWTLNQGDGTITRIDPGTNAVVATIPAGVEGSGGDIDAGAGRVWVRAKKVLLSAIDPATNEVVARYGPPAGSGAVRVAGQAVWVTAHDTNTVWAIRTGQ